MRCKGRIDTDIDYYRVLSSSRSGSLRLKARELLIYLKRQQHRIEGHRFRFVRLFVPRLETCCISDSMSNLIFFVEKELVDIVGSAYYVAQKALFAAATDTTEATLTWTLALLVNNPMVLKKAQQEIENLVGKDRKVEESDMSKLVFLQAIIKESMRLCPVAPLSIPHESTEDCIVSGYMVPKGTRLFINVWKIHHDPQIWTNPFEFQPERFLTSNKEVDVKGRHFELIPFGSGRRGMMEQLRALESNSVSWTKKLADQIQGSSEHLDAMEASATMPPRRVRQRRNNTETENNNNLPPETVNANTTTHGNENNNNPSPETVNVNTTVGGTRNNDNLPPETATASTNFGDQNFLKKGKASDTNLNKSTSASKFTSGNTGNATTRKRK
ncbi:hypothetical protein E3N88_25633 [Mikania micrantha]|uniref:Cytochrome P450 n=1 Tax=Mikania micrantha TaxID=192012 RepID=A0A5N6N5A2_9ASTR|nr:hypothetical protein E3N88_25633 [Mikania micrantha]